MNESLSLVVQKAMSVWMSIPLDDAYYAWMKGIDQDDNWKSTAWKDMSDEQATEALKELRVYRGLGE